MPVIKFFIMISRLKAWLFLFPLRIKWAWQKLTRGYSDPEWWDIDYYLARWILPRLRQLRAHTHGHPAEMKDEKEWHDILTRICLAFAIIEKYGGDRMDNEPMQKYIDEGLDLFRANFFHLWD